MYKIFTTLTLFLAVLFKNAQAADNIRLYDQASTIHSTYKEAYKNLHDSLENIYSEHQKNEILEPFISADFTKHPEYGASINKFYMLDLAVSAHPLGFSKLCVWCNIESIDLANAYTLFSAKLTDLQNVQHQIDAINIQSLISNMAQMLILS